MSHTRNPGGPAGAAAGRIVIISASVGAGHDGAAGQLARGLAAHGLTVDRHDFLDLLPLRLGRAVRGGYHRLLTHAPWAYQRIYAATERDGTGRLTEAVLRTARRRTLAVLPPDTRAVVATYPLAGQVLGALRRTGRLTVPVLTYLTDFSVHATWVADGVDTHLAAHPIPAAQAEAHGAARVEVTGPVVDPRFTRATPALRAAARARFGLPADAPLALLVAGSWGVGPIERAATEIRDRGAAVPVVVCGRNRALADRLRAHGVPYAFGWVDDMPALMHAADVLVQNAGGLTSLEAFAAGLPVASYGCIPGHGRTNAAALDAAGLAVWIRSPDDLRPVLAELLHGPRGRRQRAAGRALFTGDTAREAGGHGRFARRAAPVAGPVGAVLDAATRPVLAPVPASAATRPVRAARRRPQTRTALALAAVLAAAVLAGPEAAETTVARSGFHLLYAFVR
ncbi:MULTISPECIES: MGDG synthase family glycosyltransferase [Streptomycetaceae]|uniref:Monogalactosyldiacylglycerol synthase n=1 Tax=Streptantibioticus cattleyicolor (strain ATCC 35852 / DSM 46488 / JCM 4925 / NBRC 14057 / NRRL 8057) TaxID=1003195 RepID=F8JZN3_STREN|nr:glycosyltransferase [Streptantibioticus cattleyicolor]AEW97332.1 Monogalactosyldiacylglycerol synthase [Streptantibioticus cattleyicolor NRRL 8057 = DSM 46488]MYS61784.1 UDP-N-acetylglucosamine--N-acetylglucosamine transferase [Streptomyces sp. SID5468]CCB77656.1 UDP-N-acetylglucosamine:LPS N-acetylglucosamine transferase (modular protein) [Streptantibioticus cattleyicolor NRRL 8057 = DSM 46488]